MIELETDDARSGYQRSRPKELICAITEVHNAILTVTQDAQDFSGEGGTR